MAEELNNGTDRIQENTADVQETEQSKLPQTQQELNDLIEARVARERRSWASKARAKVKAQEPTGAEEEKQDPALLAARQDLATTQRDLAAAKAQIEAMRSGIRSEMVDDAVILALNEIERNGEEVDDISLKDALKTIKKRHPEWLVDEKGKGGFRVGADSKEEIDPGKQKNLPMSRVIF